jgi:3-oxoacyl-[acyl-carrier-protein] synthase III
VSSAIRPGAVLAPTGFERGVRDASIASIGVAVPERVVGNSEIAARLGVDESWIEKRTGVRERRRAADGERLSDLAAEAGRAALGRAAIPARELDLVIVATFTQDELLPAAAPLVAGRIGADRAGTMDLGAACTGFLSALALAAGQVEAGRADAALVVGADLVSRVIDYDDRSTAGLFGDGAGAGVVRAGGPGRIGPIVLSADPYTGPACINASHADRKIRMRGQDTFRAAVARLSESTVEAVAAAGLELDEVDLFVYHQANTRIIGAVGERLGLPGDRVVDCIERYGNTSAASIPIALREAEELGRLPDGATVLVAAFAAGFVWGAGVIEWGCER